MLRRRIFSGAMASVMALSSVAVVASAEETQVKSKADLEKLVNETYGDAFRADKLSEFGTLSAEAVMDALEAADAVLYDADADAEDYTVAYMMVEATVARLAIYTADQLQTLINDTTGIYESGNIYNEELGDMIYDPAKYDAFCTEYDDALAIIDSASSADITDAYEKLMAAKNDCVASKLPVVTKSQFRSVLKQYEALLSATKDYESWRVGTISWTNDVSNLWVLTNNTNSVMAYGALMEICMDLNENINAQYKALDSIKAATKTTNTDMYNAYLSAKDAVGLFKAWTVDSAARATKSGVKNLLDQYHGVMVYEFNTTAAEDLYDALETAVKTLDKGAILFQGVDADGNVVMMDDAAKGTYGLWEVTNGGTGTANLGWTSKTTDAGLTVKPNKTLYIPILEGVWTGDAVLTEKPADYASSKYKMLSANTKFDITKLIDVPVANVENAGGKGATNAVVDVMPTEYPEKWGTYATAGFNAADTTGDYSTDLGLAYSIATSYLAGTYVAEGANVIAPIDDTESIVTEGKGNSKEWAIVYRYLNYALTDRYDASAGGRHTRADVKALIEQCYELAELTGDAAIFRTAHNAMVEARQDAIEWLREANADGKYKDFYAGKDYDSSESRWNKLNGAYDTLLKEYNAMKYSFGDIYAKLAEVSEMIDDGDLEAKADLMEALDKTAYCLSVVSDEVSTAWGYVYTENAAYTVDREFVDCNRVITTEDAINMLTIVEEMTPSVESWALAEGLKINCQENGANGSHWNLWKAYESLLAAVEAQTAPQVLLGDVDANGTVNALDAAALLTAIVDGKTLDAAVADYDKSGAVNALDASAILTAIVNG